MKLRHSHRTIRWYVSKIKKKYTVAYSIHDGQLIIIVFFIFKVKVTQKSKMAAMHHTPENISSRIPSYLYGEMVTKMLI